MYDHEELLLIRKIIKLATAKGDLVALNKAEARLAEIQIEMNLEQLHKDDRDTHEKEI